MYKLVGLSSARGKEKLDSNMSFTVLQDHTCRAYNSQASKLLRRLKRLNACDEAKRLLDMHAPQRFDLATSQAAAPQ